MSIDDQTFYPGDCETTDRRERKLEKKIRKLKERKDEEEKKRKKLKKEIKKLSQKLSVYESTIKERELRYQVELKAAKLEALLQICLKQQDLEALPEVVAYHDK